MAHDPSDHEVVRAKQRIQKHAQHQNRTMVTKRERRYNRLYPNDAAAAVLVSNETHWYMLPIKLIIPTALHSKMSVVHFHLDYALF